MADSTLQLHDVMSVTISLKEASLVTTPPSRVMWATYEFYLADGSTFTLAAFHPKEQ